MTLKWWNNVIKLADQGGPNMVWALRNGGGKTAVQN